MTAVGNGVGQEAIVAHETYPEDGLEELRADVMGDPAALAAFQDATRRTRMLAAMSSMRLEQGLTQKAVAMAMHTTQSAVSEIESGRADPRLRTLQRYARAIRRRLDIAMVEEDLPASDEGMANELWRLVESTAVGPLLTGLTTQAEDSRRTLEALARDFAHLPHEIVRPILASLQKRGWVTSEGHGLQKVYALNEEAAYVIGVSIHSHEVVGVLLDLRGEIIDDRTVCLATTTQEAVKVAVVKAVVELFRHDREMLGVGVTLAGVVDSETGTVKFAPDLCSAADEWTGVPLEADLQHALQEHLEDQTLRVAVENDANALALSEYLRSGERSVAAVLLSESGGGVGAGFVCEGDVIYGASHAAGEAGHLVVDPQGKPCRESREHAGCVETVSSARAILDGLGVPADTSRRVRDGLVAANDRVRRQDEEATGAFRAAGEALGHVLATVMILLDPVRVAVYGHPELVQGGDEYPSADHFRAGIVAGLKGGLSKGEPFAHRLNWQQLESSTEARAAGAAAMRRFLYKPGLWRPSVLV